ncbi:MAG: S8 family serine peptidase [Phycisphaeraceae bacterium]
MIRPTTRALLALSATLLVAATIASAQDVTQQFLNATVVNATNPLGDPTIPPPAGPGATPGSKAFNSGLINDFLSVEGGPAVEMGQVRLDLAVDYKISGLAGAQVDAWLVYGYYGDIAKNAAGNTSFSYRARVIPEAAGVFNPAVNIFDFNPAAITTTGTKSLYAIQPLGNINANNYRVLQETTLSADTAAAMPAVTNALDFFQSTGAGITLQDRGIFATLVTAPRGLPNSRDAIGVAAARANATLTATGANLNGSGIKIGQIELGVPSANHKDLKATAPNRVLTIQPNSTNPGYRSEHAHAVAGIMVGRSANAAQAGVANGATLFSSASLAQGSNDSLVQRLRAFDDLVDTQGINVFNASFGVSDNPSLGRDIDDGNSPPARFYDWLVDKKRVIGVVSAGNTGDASRPDAGEAGRGNTGIADVSGTISGNNGGYNVITVGALDYDFKARAYYSSFGTTNFPTNSPRTKPDLVAPGTFILTTAIAAIDGANGQDDYARNFFGVDDFNRPGVSAGAAITGTSFAAPHVAGGAAIMLELANKLDGNLNGDRSRPQVVKAILMNSADRTVLHRDGSPWAQGNPTGDSVTRPLDDQLGAGMIDLDRALLNLVPNEAKAAEDPSTTHQATVIGVTNKLWDWQVVDKAANKGEIASYQFKKGIVRGDKVRATITWHRQTASADGDLNIEDTDTFNVQALNNLNMFLYNRANTSEAWVKEFQSVSAHDNVELFNDKRIARNGFWAVDVWNRSANTEGFAIAIEVNSNPAAVGGITPWAFSSHVTEADADIPVLGDLLPVEANSGIYMKPTFSLEQLAAGEDLLHILDDNLDYTYASGATYNVFWGAELRDVPDDTFTDTDWFQGLIPDMDSLLSLNNWQQATSGLVDADGNLTPAQIADPQFWQDISDALNGIPTLNTAAESLAALVNNQVLEFNFVVDVDGDRLFSPDVDGVGWFQVTTTIPEPTTTLLTLSLLALNQRKYA